MLRGGSGVQACGVPTRSQVRQGRPTVQLALLWRQMGVERVGRCWKKSSLFELITDRETLLFDSRSFATAVHSFPVSEQWSFESDL